MSDDDRVRAEVRAVADRDGAIREAILAGRPIDPDLAERVEMLEFRDRAEPIDLGVVARLPRLRRLDLSGFPALETLVAVCLRDAVLWPAEFPATLRELIIGDAAWPEGRPLPDLPRLITPDWRLIDDGAPCSDAFEFWRLVCLAEDTAETAGSEAGSDASERHEG